MRSEVTATMVCDGAALAKSVRTLARRAHLVVTRAKDGVDGDEGEIGALLQQIEQTQDQVRCRRPDDLRRWLDNLQQQVEDVRLVDASGPGQGPHSSWTAA